VDQHVDLEVRPLGGKRVQERRGEERLAHAVVYPNEQYPAELPEPGWSQRARAWPPQQGSSGSRTEPSGNLFEPFERALEHGAAGQ
jgi:hypothetical protein